MEEEEGLLKEGNRTKDFIVFLIPDQWDVCPYLGHFISTDTSFLYFKVDRQDWLVRTPAGNSSVFEVV